MEANELRVGNWVYCTYDHVNIEILPSDIQLAGQFESIPLTEEWLIKFGFEKIDVDYYYDGRLALEYKDNTCSISNISETYYNKIQSVHQLQNLYFALTREELKYDK